MKIGKIALFSLLVGVLGLGSMRAMDAPRELVGTEVEGGFILLEEPELQAHFTDFDPEQSELEKKLAEAMKENLPRLKEITREHLNLTRQLNREIEKSHARIKHNESNQSLMQKEVHIFDKIIGPKVNALREKIYALYSRSVIDNWNNYYLGLIETMQANFAKAPGVEPREAYEYLGLSPEEGKDMSVAEIRSIIDDQRVNVPEGSDRMWDLRQIGYVFRNEITKEEYDAFLAGQEEVKQLYEQALKNQGAWFKLFTEKLIALQTALQDHLSYVRKLLDQIPVLPESEEREAALEEAVTETF